MRYRKKPIIVEAEQFWPEKKPWPEGIEQDAKGFYIRTLEGPFIVTPGDWIITGIIGERYPCKPDIFEATYEQVDGTT